RARRLPAPAGAPGRGARHRPVQGAAGGPRRRAARRDCPTADGGGQPHRLGPGRGAAGAGARGRRGTTPTEGGGGGGRRERPPAEAAALAPPMRVRTNLRAQITSFVGRAEDIARITAVLAGARLVTLTGAGGAGKTRPRQRGCRAPAGP